MSQTTILVSHFFDGTSLHRNTRIYLSQGQIERLEFNQNNPEESTDGIVIPGLIDLQVNGGGGYLFNDSPSVDTLRKIAQSHHQFGTTGWLPTLITDSLTKMEQAADAVSIAIKDDSLGILGIHFEGPHISKCKKGVHSESFIRSISDAEWMIYQRKDLGKILVTLAPENVTVQTVERLVRLGVKVSIGHTNASYDSVKNLIASGASGFTHLFNAMSGLESREPGAVGAALDSDCYLGIILDGIHCHPISAKVAYRSNKKLMLVTDAMPPVGTDKDIFHLFSEQITRKGMKLTNNQGQIAGSNLNMYSALSNAQTFLGIGLVEASLLASQNPAAFLDLDARHWKLEEGANANMVLADNKGRLNQVWLKGRPLLCPKNE